MVRYITVQDIIYSKCLIARKNASVIMLIKQSKTKFYLQHDPNYVEANRR